MLLPLLLSLLLPAPAWQQTFDFRHFEAEIFPVWQSLFLTGEPARGEYGLLPAAAHNVTSFYGTTDMVYATHACGLLDQMPQSTRALWAATIKQFQNRSTGWIVLQPWETMHTGE